MVQDNSENMNEKILYVNEDKKIYTVAFILAAGHPI